MSRLYRYYRKVSNFFVFYFLVQIRETQKRGEGI